MSIHRRRFLQAGAFSTAMSMSGWLGSIATAAAKNPERKRSCILLWMAGGPSTIDLWDLKPGHANGGEFKPIEAAPGLQISEHLPTGGEVRQEPCRRPFDVHEGRGSLSCHPSRTHGPTPDGGDQLPLHRLASVEGTWLGGCGIAQFRQHWPIALFWKQRPGIGLPRATLRPPDRRAEWFFSTKTR